jgi:flavodoxin
LFSRKEKILRAFLGPAVKLLSPRRMRECQRMFFKATQVLREVLHMNNALIVYHSETGNTGKVAAAIERGLAKEGVAVTVKTVGQATEKEFYDYDLVCFGSPVLHSLPPPPVLAFIKTCERAYRDANDVRVSSPSILGKCALVFCTYSGPHCGVNEALPTGKYIRQFFEHLGFDVKAEWYEVGEFHGYEELSTKGRLGDIRGRPDDDDLAMVELKTIQLVKTLRPLRSGAD